MPDATSRRPSTQDQLIVRDREGITMLLHEALARSRMREAEQAAREYAAGRMVTAGTRWALLARFAGRRADRARTTAGAPPLRVAATANAGRELLA